MKAGNRRRNRNRTEISMLNLIDVIFMLLIFFMLATTFNNYGQFKLAVPEVDTDKLESADESRTLEVIIDKDRKYYLRMDGSQKEITEKSLGQEISGIDRTLLKSVKITADENLEYRIIMGVMSELKNQGIKNVILNLRKAD